MRYRVTDGPVGHDRADADALAARLDREHVSAPPAIGGAVTVGEFLRGTWLPQKRRRVRATTAYRYAWFIDRYIDTEIGNVPLRRLRTDHLDGLYQQLAATGGRHGTGLAPKTELEVHLIIRAALEAALQRESIGRNVANTATARLPRARATTARACLDRHRTRHLPRHRPVPADPL